jgi:hypothetical protein
MYATGDARRAIHVSYLSYRAIVSEMSFHFNTRGCGLGSADPICSTFLARATVTRPFGK